MAISTYRLEKIEALKQKAIELYKQGLTSREVAREIGRSHTWVCWVVKERLPDAIVAR